MALAIHAPDPHAYALRRLEVWCQTQAAKPPLVEVVGMHFDEGLYQRGGKCVTCMTCIRMLFVRAQFYDHLRSKGITVKTEGDNTAILWGKRIPPSPKKTKQDPRQRTFADLFGDEDVS